MNDSTQENISEIKSLIAEAEEYNGQQRSPSINTVLYGILSRVRSLSDGEVTFAFESENNSNSRLGAYRITVFAPDDVEALLNSSNSTPSDGS